LLAAAGDEFDTMIQTDAVIDFASQSGRNTRRIPGFEEIYEIHFQFVWRSLRRLRVSDVNLKDAVQDVFVVVHRRLEAFEGRSEISTWLFGISLRVARGYRRRAHARREVLDDRDFAWLVDPKGDTGAVAERHQQLALFEAALDEISVEKRAVFILFELENLTGDQIADRLAIPLGTVYSRLRLARAALKRATLAQTLRWHTRSTSRTA
jgi:RNA polymerase sigma-70 factor (ECF subfamily)